MAKKLNENKERLLAGFSKNTMKTVNQVIDSFFRSDIKKGLAVGKGWRYYVHLNKLPAILQKEGKLEYVGDTNDGEKLWVRKD